MSSSNTVNEAVKREEDSEQETLSSFKKQKVEYDQFVRSETRCFKIKEYGSVYFSSFNPIWPLLGCGLSNGEILIIEGQRQTDLVGTWTNKTWQKTNAISAMTGLGWNMDGTLLLTTFLEGKIVLWNQTTETLTGIEDSNSEEIWAIAWNPFQNNIFATRNNQTVIVWDEVHNHPKAARQRFAFHSSLIRDLAWISKDKFFSCFDDGSILLCEIGTDSPIKSFNHGVGCSSAFVLEQYLKISGMPITERVWSIKSDEPIYFVKNERMKRPTCLTWYLGDSTIAESSGTLIACGLEDGSVVLWDTCGNSDPVRILLVQSNSIWDVSFSPDGMFLTSIDLQGNLVIWSTKTWHVVFQSILSFLASKRILQWGGGGHKLAIANPSEEIHLIEAAAAVKTNET